MIRKWALWPLDSPKRLALTALAVVAVFALIGTARGSGGRGRTPAAAVNVSAASPASPSSTIPKLSTTASSTSPVSDVVGSSTTTTANTANTASPATAAQLAAATAWVAAWCSHQPQPQWTQTLTPLSTPTMAAALGTVDPNNVPATAVLPGASGQGDSGGATIRVPTDAGVVAIIVTSDGHGGWVIADVQPVAK